MQNNTMTSLNKRLLETYDVLFDIKTASPIMGPKQRDLFLNIALKNNYLVKITLLDNSIFTGKISKFIHNKTIIKTSKKIYSFIDTEQISFIEHI